MFFIIIKRNRITAIESKKILIFLNKPYDSKFVTKTCNIVNYQSNTIYAAGNGIIYSAEALKSNILERGDIPTIRHNYAVPVHYSLRTSQKLMVQQ